MQQAPIPAQSTKLEKVAMAIRTDLSTPSLLHRDHHGQQQQQQQQQQQHLDNDYYDENLNLTKDRESKVAGVNSNPTRLGIVPVSVAVPGNGVDYNKSDQSKRMKKFSDFVETAEIQAGRESMQINAERQREQIWSKIAHKLIVATRQASSSSNSFV